MLLQALSGIIVFLLRYVLRVVVAISLIPVGVFFFLQNVFPEFSYGFDFYFWLVLGIISLVGFVLLWKPILWIMGAITVLGAGVE